VTAPDSGISMHLPHRFRRDRLHIEIHPDPASAGRAAADSAARALVDAAAHSHPVPILFAAAASQVEVLRALTSLPDLPWTSVVALHLDEYAGIPATHPASFRRFLHEHLTTRVPLGGFHEIPADAADLNAVCPDYARKLRLYPPQLSLLGIGENGHLAFNDPGEADFADPADVKLVSLDPACRAQQVAEGWFPSLDQVPQRAITVTIPALMRVPRLIVSVPGARKAPILRRVLHEAISPACPATILRRHPNATLYLDRASAAHLEIDPPLA
jgi:glucosamine-6-phosphate deaminase